MRRSGPISFALSLTIHGGLIGAAILSIRATTWSPPKIHLVYGEHGGENSRANIVVSGADAPPAADLSQASPARISAEALDAEIFGKSFDSAAAMGSEIAAPLLMTADGDGSGLAVSLGSEETRKFRF